jgi:DNA repair protein RadD
MGLRPYQSAGIDRTRFAVNSLLAAGRPPRVLITGPCGCGKGTVISTLQSLALRRGNRSISITHREELVLDLAERITREVGRRPGVILAGATPDPTNPVQVASIQTLARRDKPPADLVNIDEAHRGAADSYVDVIEYYPKATIIGLTASPCRLSGRALGDVFEELVELVKPAQLVEEGFLVPVTGFAYDAPDLRGVRRAAGDYAVGELAALMGSQRLRGNVVEQYLRHAAGTRAIVFSVNVEHSKALAAEFRSAGVRAQHLDGETPRDQRKVAFAAFASGAIEVLCNVQLFTEGVDLPAIETVILARPTLSLAMAIQMIGRGRRPLPCECGLIPHWRNATCTCGRPVLKRSVRIHDHAGVIFQHGLPDEPRVWTLKGDYRPGTGKKSEPSTALRTCRQCFAIYLADRDDCPMCGHRNPAKKRVTRNASGVAVAIANLERKAEPPPSDANQMKRYFLYCLGIEREKKHKRLYAEMRFMGTYKHWPKLAKQWRAEFAQGLCNEPHAEANDSFGGKHEAASTTTN